MNQTSKNTYRIEWTAESGLGHSLVGAYDFAEVGAMIVDGYYGESKAQSIIKLDPPSAK